MAIGTDVGNWVLEALLGSGGFADVYKAKHKFLSRVAAIKLLKGLWPDTDGFVAEAQLVARLQHPNIIQVLDFGLLKRNTPYLVMTYAGGGSLRDRFPQGTPVPLSTVLDIVRPIGSALQYAHDQGSIHRDVKPENILLDEQGALYLSDFGAAVAMQAGPIQDVVIGTPDYMSPEQAARRAEPRSDEYSLAAMVRELLTGSPVFNGRDGRAVMYRHLTEAVPSLPTNLGLSDEVNQVIMRALAKQADQRFPTVTAFVTALEQAGKPKVQAVQPVPRPTAQSTRPAPVVVSRPVQSEFTYRGHSQTVQSLCWSPTDNRIASADNDGRVHMWNSDGSSVQIANIHPRGPTGITWNPTGMRILSTFGITPIHWNAATFGDMKYLNGHTAPIVTIAWGNRASTLPLIATGDKTGVVCIWNPAQANPLRTMTFSEGIRQLAWSPDNQLLAVLTDGNNIHVYNAYNWQREWGFSESWQMNTIAWSFHDSTLAIGGKSRAIVLIRPTGQLMRRLIVTEQVSQLSWAPGHNWLGVAQGNDMVLYEGASEHSRLSLSGIVSLFSWSNDGTRMAIVQGGKLIDIKSIKA